MAHNRISDFATTLSFSVTYVGRLLARGLNLVEAEQVLPRRWCHYTTLSLRGVPRKHAESAIRLQLNQLGMFSKTGFTYLASGDQAKVWYWNDEQAQLLFSAGKALPYPEPLWRAPIETGVRFIRCVEGFELEGSNEQGVYRSRWFAQLPDESEIQAFYRDIGLPTNTVPEPPRSIARLRTPLRDWKISSDIGGQLSPKVWLTGLAILLAGCIATSELVQIIRVKQETQTLNTEAVALKKQTAAITALESSIKKLQPTAQLLADQMQTPQQTTLLAGLIRSNVIGPNADVYLSEWSYRSSSIATTLRMGPKAKGADVLSALEQTGLFSEIRLLPDPPANSLRIELKLAGQANSTSQNASAPQETER